MKVAKTLLLASFVLCWTIDGRPQTEDQPNGSNVRGVVVYSDTGRPLRHARVTLFGDNRLELFTATDLRGRFEFQNVEEGKYRLAVEAPGLLVPYSNVARARSVDPDPRFPDIDEVVTQVTVNGIDSVDLKIKAVRGGVITGRVVNDDDQPVQHADITLLRREKGKWVPLWRIWPGAADAEPERADATGVYRIAGLASGEYLVRASEPIFNDDFVPGDEDAYSDGSFFVAYHPAATRFKDAKAVSVTAGNETSGVDIRMPQQAPHTLSGTIKSKLLEKPTSNFDITVERSDEAGFSTTIQNATAGANREGQWKVPALPAGEYLVTITGTAITVNDGNVEHERTLPKRVTVKLQDQKVTTLDTTLTLGAGVVGTVMLNGKPLASERSLTAAVMPAEDSTGSNNKPDDTETPSFEIGVVNSRGKFSIAPLLSGTYWFTFSFATPDEFYVKSVTRKGIDLMQSPFKLTDEELFGDVVVALATDFPNVEGQVTLPETDAERSTVRDVTIVIGPADEVTSRFNPGTRILQGGVNGKVAFRSPPGEYLIAAITTAEYKTIAPEINKEYFLKNADKFLRIKLSAGEKVKDLRVPMLKN